MDNTVTQSTDRIEKQVTLRAVRSKVWQALTDSQQFGEWFRVNLEGPFVTGTPINGNILHPGYEHVKFTAWVEAIQPEHYFSFRWHPYGVDKDVDYSLEPTTLCEFRLEDVPEGTRLTLVESGFDALPAERRDIALRMNTKGWEAQLEKNIREYVEK
jgi:uncharacterized protein YndB with AHSA1/START domain